MHLLYNGEPLYTGILNMFIDRVNLSKEEGGEIKKRFLFFTKSLLKSKLKKKVFPDWADIDDFVYFLTLRVLIGTEFKIYPSQEYSEEEISYILELNEITYNNFTKEAPVIYLSKNTMRMPYQELKFIPIKDFTSNLKKVRAMKLIDVDENTTNYDQRVDEILEGFPVQAAVQTLKLENEDGSPRHIDLVENDRKFERKNGEKQNDVKMTKIDQENK